MPNIKPEWEPTVAQKRYWESLKTKTGANAPNWKKTVGKSQVHKWLETHYGKPKICEIGGCTKKCEWFDWALRKGKLYERKRTNFLRLCRSCHRKYDLTEKKKSQAIDNLWWKRGIPNPGNYYGKK